MKSILIIEDDEEKEKQLADFLETEFAPISVSFARSQTSGLKAALLSDYDLILLDMTMTNFDRSQTEDGGRPQHFAGREILRQMGREGRVTPTVIVTQFDRFGQETEARTLQEMEINLEASFSNYKGTIRYRENIDDWKLNLRLICAEVLLQGDEN